MKFKELFNGNIGGAANVGASRFRLSNDKEKVMSPHTVMAEVYNILETRPALRSGLTDIIRFLLNDIGITSQDEKSVAFLTEWLEKRPQLENELFNFAFSLLGVGTAYTQASFKDRYNGEKILDNIKAVPNSSLIYYNFDAKNDNADDYWLMEVPFEVQEYDGRKPEYRPVWYIKGSRFYSKYIWCISYPKKAYERCVFGHSMNLPHYGWGLLSTSVDNEDTQREIIKNWALQAKYRALGKKIIGFYNTSDESVSLQELEDIKTEFQSLEEEDSIIVNKRFDQVDLSFNGQDAGMDQQIEWLRKDSGSALTPNYMGAFSQDSSMATAAEAKIPFGLKLKSIQPTLINYFNTIIINPLRKAYPWLAEDCTFTLGTPELYSRDEVFNMMIQLYNMRACTFNELRVGAGLEPVEGGDKWGSEPPLENTKVNLTDKNPQDNNSPSSELKEFKNTYKEALKEIAPINVEERLKASVKIPKRDGEDSKSKQESIKTATKKLLK